MAYLDKTGFQHFWSKLKTLFALKTDIPTSLPANGGNADTVDNKHASDFALTTDLEGYATEEWVDQKGFVIANEGAISDPLPEYATVEYIESLDHITRAEMLTEIDRQIQGAIHANY